MIIREAQGTNGVSGFSNADELARYLIDSFQGTTLRTKLCRDRTELMSFSELALTVFCRKSFFKDLKNDWLSLKLRDPQHIGGSDFHSLPGHLEYPM